MGHQQEDNEIKTEITELPGKIYNDTLQEVIKEHFGSSKDCEISFAPGSNKGDGYMGVMHRVTVKYPTQDELKVIVKLPPQSQARREQFFAKSAFNREAVFYEKIFPLFAKFQAEKGIDVEKEGFYQTPKCYKSLVEEPFEGLFFEDLKASGFDMFNRFNITSPEHVNLVMRALGKYHAISLAMKDQRPELIKEYQELQELFFERDEESMKGFNGWFNANKSKALELLENCENKDLVQKATKALEPNLIELMRNLIVGDLAEPYAVLCHGDCWNNNMMFREENGVPVEIRLLDWQVVRYATGVTDLVYYIFNCTTKEVRDKHYEEFLNTYHETLSNFLIRLGSDPKKLFPREAFNEQLKRFGLYGFAMSVILLPIITSKPEDSPDFDELAEKFKENQDNGTEIPEMELGKSTSDTFEAYKKRMLGVFEDMYRLGYI